MKHWTKHLPESGTIYSHNGKYQEVELMRIVRMEEELKSLKVEYKKKEKELEKSALTDWTKEEIEEAKLKSILIINGA